MCWHEEEEEEEEDEEEFGIVTNGGRSSGGQEELWGSLLVYQLPRALQDTKKKLDGVAMLVKDPHHACLPFW